VRPTTAVRAVFGLEIRSLLRDPRTVFLSVVLPVVLIPLLLLGASWADDRRVERAEERSFRLAVVGPDADFARALVWHGEDSWRGDDSRHGADSWGGAGSSHGADSLHGDDSTRAADSGRFRPVEVADPTAALESGSIDLYLEAFTPEAWRELREAHDGDPRYELPPELDGGRVVRIRFHATRTASREGMVELRDRLLDARQARRDSMMVAAGFPVDPERVAVVESGSVAAVEDVRAAGVGRYLTLILLTLMVLGGSAVATDTLAGEKERGTLETLLTSAASRTEIVTGKLLAVMAVAFTISFVQVVNLWVFLGLGLIEPAAAFAVHVSPGLALGLLVLYLPVVALTSGLLLLSSAHASSYKEAQLYLMPVLLGLILPGVAPLLPDLSLASAVVVVPIANLALGARDLLIGQAQLPWLAAAWLVTAGAAAWVTRRSVRALHDESLVTGAPSTEEVLGGAALFPKRVVRWFAAFWGVKIILDLNLPLEDVRAVALVSVGAAFLLFPLVVIRHFRLDPVQALALRKPRPGVWAGVLLGAPAALVAAASLAGLVDRVVPMPAEMLESFGQAIMPEAVPVWQLVLFLAVLPGIAEELTFRGVLLHGLRRRLGPVGLALVVGLVFGFFHFQLFRIPSTAFLGVALAAVTLMTGSIFPAIAWHVLNNAIAIGLGAYAAGFAPDGWGWGLGSVVALGLAFRIIWLNRTPYPGVGGGPGGVSAPRRGS
jgi:sodium transport system permease protein